MSKKFLRTTNFSSREESVLINLVKKYKDEVECKKSDTKTNKIKAEAWTKIENEFNCVNGEPFRNSKVLKNKYENIKKRGKQKFADHKKYVTGTGGGPSKEIVITETDSSLHEILGTELTGLSSQFDRDSAGETIILHVEDNDNIFEPEATTSTTREQKIEENCEQSELEYSVPLSNWTTYIPSMLKRPVSASLLQQSENKEKTPKGKRYGLGTKLELWAKNKSSLVNTQEKCFMEKHELTLEHMREQHQQKMTIENKEYKIKMKFLAEQHSIKMEILRLELQSKDNKE